jgi:predicted cupin superfamily sugar epimerase
MSVTAEEIIIILDLQPHPEGGWYRETFNSRADGETRGTLTAIYFLLKKGQTSHWHRVTDADEVWSWVTGGSLSFSHIAPAKDAEDKPAVQQLVIGMNLAAGEVPQLTVKAGHWQTASAREDFVLVTCVTSPGFVFDSFELAPQDFQPGFIF